MGRDPRALPPFLTVGNLRIIHRASTLSTIHRSLAEIKDSKRKDFDMLADVLCDPGSLFRGGLRKTLSFRISFDTKFSRSGNGYLVIYLFQ